jgi:hypothetical protein
VASHGVFVNHVCRVVRFFPLQCCKLIRISTTLLDMSEDLSLCSKEVIQLHYVCYKNYKDDVDYFVVMA